MEFKEVTSHDDLMNRIGDLEKAYLLLYKKGSETSECALDNLKKVDNDEVKVFVADVTKVRDIHPHYGIKTVPTLLAFSGGEYENVVKGCNDPDFYLSFFESTSYVASDEEGPSQPDVTVYSTPTCTWCNALKTHLRKHKIRFTDIDVSRDASLAEELVRKSGQQGVPQTEINGEIIVGFDKTRINKLLNINA